MTQKENCKSYCMEQLQQLGLEQYFNMEDFNHYYRKHKGYMANAFVFGTSIADFIISQSHERIIQNHQLLNNLQNIYHGSQY